jgi:hypothetical protein
VTTCVAAGSGVIDFRRYCAVWPPSTEIAVPVIRSAAAEQRKASTAKLRRRDKLQGRLFLDQECLECSLLAYAHFTWRGGSHPPAR